MNIAYLDHYDSFTFNLIDWLLADTAVELRYVAADDRLGITALEAGELPLVISPGPLRPDRLPHTMNLLRNLLGRVPILGVCLGHQCLGSVLGGRIVRAKNPFHGSRQEVRILRNYEFINSLSTPLVGGHYNSLVVERGSIDERLVWAENAEEEIEGLYWNEGLYPALGVQYHPESFLSEGQDFLKQYWLKMIGEFYEDRRRQERPALS